MIEIKPMAYTERLWNVETFGAFHEIDTHTYEVRVKLKPQMMDGAIEAGKTINEACSYIMQRVIKQLEKRGKVKLIDEAYERRPMIFDGGVEQLVFKVKFK